MIMGVEIFVFIFGLLAGFALGSAVTKSPSPEDMMAELVRLRTEEKLKAAFTDDIESEIKSAATAKAEGRS